MKRLFSIMLAICLITGIAVPARAAEESEDEVSSEESMEETVTVSTLDELTEAIKAADNGDTIAISQTILVNGESIFTEKSITIVRSVEFESGYMFSAKGGSIIGLNFQNSGTKNDIFLISGQFQDMYFEDCLFDGGNAGLAINIFAPTQPFSVTIVGCEFRNCYGNAVGAKAKTDVVLNNCYIHDNYAIDASGAIQSSGKLTLNECIIKLNTSVANAGVFSTGTLTISDCEIKDNIATNEYDKVAVDIFCNGTWSITDESHEDAGFYEVTTGEKIVLPITESASPAKLIYLSDDEAAEYFAPAPNPDDNTDIPGEDNNVPPEEGKEDPDEGDDSEDKTDDEPETPPTEEPQAPESGDNITNPDDEQSQPNDSSEEDNTDTSLDEETPSVTPQEPPESSDDSEDDYTPPVSHRPIYRPTKPVVTIPEPKPAPALACGDAVIDTSRSVILEGYGDGLLHLEDNLTRAQMATIIYRLLDADSIEKYDNTDSAFEDVAPDAWYCRYVSTIARAGIVCGIGNGYYNPDAPLTWGHIITVLSRFVDAQDYELQYIQYDGWALDAVKTAVALGWIEDSVDFNPDKIISRGEFVELVNSVIETYR